MPEQLSGAMRFSVDSLLFYAPKVKGAGEGLAEAVAAAQRRLLGLGDFFGRAWPDEPFRHSYPRCQYAMLIIVRQLAEEIQGIGEGIELMARSFGITEDQNTTDIRRIQVNQGHADARISGTGGLPAPPGFAPSPAPRKPSRSANPFEHPSPAPAASPEAKPSVTVTTAAVPGEITPSSFAPSATPPPELTPSPEPGLNPTVWKQKTMVSLRGPFPSGDPDKMDEAAACWATLGAALDEAWTALQRYTAYIMADTQGKAAEAFQDYVDGLTGKGHGSLSRAIDAVQELRKACLKQASEIRETKTSMEQMLLGLAASIFIGQFVSLITFETTQELSDAIDVGIAAKLTQLAEFFEKFSETLAENMQEAVVPASKVLGQMGAAGLQSAVITDVNIEASDLIGRAFGEPPAPGSQVLLETLEGGALGMFLGQGSAGGLLGVSARALSKRLISMGESLQQDESRDPDVGRRLALLGVRLKDGSITVSAANSAATQLITQHQITPLTFFSGVISNRLTTAISPDPGVRAKG